MADLLSHLLQSDLNFLQDIAELWGVEPVGKDAHTYARSLRPMLLETELFSEVVEALPQLSQQALAFLNASGGSMPWTDFVRHFGPLRPMGPRKREREKPARFPISATEKLWYLGLIGRRFTQTDTGLEEEVYLPDEFLSMLGSVSLGELPEINISLQPVPTEDVLNVQAASDEVLDEACSLLALLRRSDRNKLYSEIPLRAPELLLTLLEAAELTDKAGRAPTLTAKRLLELPRGEALLWLTQTWRSNRFFNELRLLPSIVCEGTWQNDPIPPRRILLNFLSDLPTGEWFALSDLSAAIQTRYPDFLRKGSQYDAWLISDKTSGELLRGVESWPQVEGAWIAWVLALPCTLLGLLHSAWSAGREEPLYQKSTWFEPLVQKGEPVVLPAENDALALSSDGLISMTNLSPRIARYQISRFAEWVEGGPRRFRYHLTPASLSEAGKQKLTVKHLLRLIRQYAPPNPALEKAILRWQEKGRETWLSQPVVLHLESAELLASLRNSPANAFLGEALGPAAVLVKPGKTEKLRAALARLGFLSDFELQGGSRD